MDSIDKVSFNEKNQLNKLKFYHGVQTKEDIVKIMKEAKIGDFLLRSAFLKSEVSLVLFLCVKVAEKIEDIHHYLLEQKGERFTVKQETKDLNGKKEITDSPPFSTYEEMASYYRLHRLACGIRLNRALKRPKWQLRHSEVVYDENGKLGSGNFCIVYKGKLNRKNEEEKCVAIKVSKCSEQDSAVLMETRNQLVAEAKIMVHYNHINVIKLFGLACDMPPFMVCMEYCIGGSLENHLYANGGEMEEFEKQTFLIDASRGMRYLHAQKCIHRDLASRNCLISHEGIVKIADFGLSKALTANQTAIKEVLKEAPLVWMAPECIQKESEFSAKTDVWAFGVLIYEVYFDGAKPFADEKNTGVILKSIRKAKMPPLGEKTNVPKMQQLLDSIWAKKPDERPEFQKILEMLVEALVPHCVKDVRNMKVNRLPGVTRKKMPNIDIEMDEIAAVAPTEFEVSERKKKKERTSRRLKRVSLSKTKTIGSSDTTNEEKHLSTAKTISKTPTNIAPKTAERSNPSTSYASEKAKENSIGKNMELEKYFSLKHKLINI